MQRLGSQKERGKLLLTRARKSHAERMWRPGCQTLVCVCARALKLSAAAVAVAFAGAGCESIVENPPVVTSVAPNVVTQGTIVVVRLAGGFRDGVVVAIDSVRNGTAEIRVRGVDVIQENSLLDVELEIAANAETRPHSISLMRDFDSIPLSTIDLFVRSANGPPPPQLFDVFDDEIEQGTEVILTFEGENLEGGTIQDASSGVTFGTLTVDPNTAALTATATVAIDARTGHHDLRVVTAGGISNPFPVKVVGPVFAAFTAFFAAPNTLIVGRTITIEIVGANLHAGMVVTSPDPGITASRTRVLSDHHLLVDVEATAAAPPNSRLVVQGLSAGGVVDVKVVAPDTLLPDLQDVTPSRLMRGSQVNVRCTGQFLGGPLVGVERVLTGPSVQLNGFFALQSSQPSVNPNHSVVARILVTSNAPDEGFLATRSSTGLVSGTVGLSAYDPPQTGPILFRANHSGIRRGAGPANETLFGRNLQNVTDVIFNVTGLTITNITPGADGTRVDFTVEAAISTSVTGDEATNFTVRAGNQVSNPVAYDVSR